jgi:tetraprenyl-beta-curcumene synthase
VQRWRERLAVKVSGVQRLGTFLFSAGVYWVWVFPRLRGELKRWSAGARQIPDREMRALALQALRKRANIEGAAAFASFAPAKCRPRAVCAMACFQVAYNYLDLLTEQPSAVAVSKAGHLHSLLSVALTPGSRWPDLQPHLDHDRYLVTMVDGCRCALSALPSYTLAAREAALRAAQRVTRFQAFNCGEHQGDSGGLERWSATQTPAGSGLKWWETAGSAGSSLSVYAMLAAATQLSRTVDLDELDRLYFPWVGALHSMLDQLVDLEEDACTCQRNFVHCYSDGAEAAQRIGWLAHQAVDRAKLLKPGAEARRHGLIVAAMAAMYLAAPESCADRAIDARQAVVRELGPLGRLAMVVFKLAGRNGGPRHQAPI